tara:strand:+ start:900 stop:1736 length:837 start_codon:yes stop_codon:yes gene_type:complete
MDKNNISFVITTFNSEKTIIDCLDSLPEEVKKIIIENSSNSKLKIILEEKYQNLTCYIMPENLGYGRANNFGIDKSKTDYVFILNPDVKFKKDTFNKICEILKNENFSIAAPVDFQEIEKSNFSEKDIVEADFVKGFAMILNKKKIGSNLFDENIFLYLEEIDLCKRIKNDNGRILLINSEVSHLGGLSHGNRADFEMEKSRNWHWMWSKFYYNKKHYGYIYGIVKTFPNFISSLIKTIIYSIIRNNEKKVIYSFRLRGLVSSYMLKKSSYRPYRLDN